MKNVSMPSQRAFSPLVGTIFLEISQDICGKWFASGHESFAVGYIANFQTNPTCFDSSQSGQKQRMNLALVQETPACRSGGRAAEQPAKAGFDRAE